MKRTLLISLSVAGLLFIACGGGDSSIIDGMTTNEAIQMIENKESELFGEMGNHSDSLAVVVMDGYAAFVQKNPEHDWAPEALFRSANIARSYKKYDVAIGNYKSIVEKYPSYQNLTEAHFLMAFMYDNDFKDKSRAEEVYKEVAKKYPGHVFARQASERLKTLHLSDEELIKRFREKNQPATEQVAE